MSVTDIQIGLCTFVFQVDADVHHPPASRSSGFLSCCLTMIYADQIYSPWGESSPSEERGKPGSQILLVLI
jgi:hypothetical protein